MISRLQIISSDFAVVSRNLASVGCDLAWPKQNEGSSGHRCKPPSIKLIPRGRLMARSFVLAVRLLEEPIEVKESSDLIRIAEKGREGKRCETKRNVLKPELRLHRSLLFLHCMSSMLSGILQSIRYCCRCYTEGSPQVDTVGAWLACLILLFHPTVTNKSENWVKRWFDLRIAWQLLWRTRLSESCCQFIFLVPFSTFSKTKVMLLFAIDCSSLGFVWQWCTMLKKWIRLLLSFGPWIDYDCELSWHVVEKPHGRRNVYMCDLCVYKCWWRLCSMIKYNIGYFSSKVVNRHGLVVTWPEALWREYGVRTSFPRAEPPLTVDVADPSTTRSDICNAILAVRWVQVVICVARCEKLLFD